MAGTTIKNMPEKQLNVFVSIAPSHNKNFEDILSLETYNAENILINPGNYPYNPNLWDTIITGQTKMGNPTGNAFRKIRFQLNKLRSYKKIINEAKEKIPQKKFNLYYCNLEDVLNNYFFFTFRNTILQEPILVEDGILNYYDYKLDKARYRTFKIKQILTEFFGIPFKMVTGQLSGIDLGVVKKQYVKYPQKAIYPGKALALPIKRINYTAEKDRILFIGQDILENIIGTGEYAQRFQEIIDSVKTVFTDRSQLLYKPHRNGSYDSVVPLLDKAFGKRYKLVLDNTPVEELIETIRPYHIFSFYSTALINIKMSLPEDSPVRIHSKPLDTTDAKVLDLFRESGINIIE